MRNTFLVLLLTTCTGGFVLAQNVGINGFLGIGTTSPAYKLQVNDGSHRRQSWM